MSIARRIAMPISSFLPNLGGAEVGLHNIASRLVERDRVPVVLAPAPHVARLNREGWPLPYAVEALPPKIWSILHRLPALGFLILDRFFARAQRRHGFDFWHCTFGYPTGVALVHFAKTRSDIRYLIRCAGEDIQRDPRIGYGARLDASIDRLVRDLLPQAQLLTAISDSVAEEYRALGVPEERIRHIPNGVDTERFEGPFDRHSLRARHGIPQDAFVFLCVGRNHPKKNFSRIVEAAGHLAQDTRMDFRVVLAGQGTGTLVEVVRAVGAGEHVVLIDQIGGKPSSGDLQLPGQDLVDLYRSADAFVFPSLMETFGIVIVEAMAAGLPVVVGDSPGCRDVVRNGKDGLLVDPEDAQALARAMVRLMTQESLCRSYAVKSRARAKDFSWDRVVDMYCDVYDEAAARGTGTAR